MKFISWSFSNIFSDLVQLVHEYLVINFLIIKHEKKSYKDMLKNAKYLIEIIQNNKAE